MINFLIRSYFHSKKWELVGQKPSASQYVIIMLPHTSMGDFILGWMFCRVMDMQVSVLIKREAFFFPLGLLLRRMGGIPVDRSRNRHLADQLVDYFHNRERFSLIVTPEGTRKKVKRLKRGFYQIAQRAEVPVFMGFIDIKTKRLGMGPEFTITGDYQKDIEQIRSFYEPMQGFHPDRFDPQILE